MPEGSRSNVSDQLVEWMKSILSDCRDDGRAPPTISEMLVEMQCNIEEGIDATEAAPDIAELEKLVASGEGDNFVEMYLPEPEDQSAKVADLQDKLIKTEQQLREARHVLGLVLEYAKGGCTHQVRGGHKLQACVMPHKFLERVCKHADLPADAQQYRAADDASDASVVLAAKPVPIIDRSVAADPVTTGLVYVDDDQWKAAVRLATLFDHFQRRQPHVE